ncbi:potassium channel subfamily K member 13-like [Oppia nitens]|uniref:potassium channel subfamily K member 13-like n=1 Tax=Oppia nitens TaxID=1686743 RepID=UPI0023DB63CB|nr:potassium channel subfamily K member 13-like [Oppia nitens]
MARRGRNGCCNVLHLNEDNSRFLLLALVLIGYMMFGALLFHLLEKEAEERARQKYLNCLKKFRQKYLNIINETDLIELLYEYGNATANGVISGTDRWDLPGSFYFVATVVSTIGFGMTTPKSISGRMIVIIYGFLGCSGGILFFNLFLERIITLLAYIMRRYHERKIKRDNQRRDSLYNNRRESCVSVDDRLDMNWKPSVYWVMLVLATFTVLIAVSASAVYSVVEKWSYFDCIYFCFVAFSTIGFGDLVTSQKNSGLDPCNSYIYRIVNFVFIALGCCCIYSLFNVTSIVIKQFLNLLIKKLNFRCKCWRKHKAPVLTQVARSRRNALTPNHLRSYAHSGHKTVKVSVAADSSDVDSTYDSDSERRNSNEMICMKDVIKTNKVSLAILQKELYESAQRSRCYRSPAILLPSKTTTDDFNTGTVGPLAIVSKKLGEEND